LRCKKEEKKEENGIKKLKISKITEKGKGEREWKT